MPASKIIKAPLIVQRQGLLDRPAEIGKVPALNESILLRTLSRAGAVFGVGRAVMINSLLPVRNTFAGQNRARPPPCMRWRGPGPATLHQVGQLPDLPGPAGPGHAAPSRPVA